MRITSNDRWEFASKATLSDDHRAQHLPLTMITVRKPHTFIYMDSYDNNHCREARHAGSDGSSSPSGSAGPGFHPRRGSKFSFENFQPRG